MPVRRPSPEKSVSVGYELLTLQQAIEGVSVLVELQREGGLDDGDISAGVAALLALVGCRVRDLGRVVRGAMDASAFRAAHNEALGGIRRSDDPDVLLRAPLPRRDRGHSPSRAAPTRK